MHSLAEGACEVVLPASQLRRVTLLQSALGAQFLQGTGEGELPISRLATIDHRQPLSRIGTLTRPLISCHAIINTLRAGWPASRANAVSFVGLLTPARRNLLAAWCAANLPADATHLASLDTLGRRPSGAMQQLVRGCARHTERVGPLLLSSSTRGRRVPFKAWDVDYFRVLQASRFVLCPVGDHDWTYRFFEAVLCGSIPIVERAVPLHEGFICAAATDPLPSLTWGEEAAVANFRRAVAMLTVSPDGLNRELRLVG